MQNANYTVTIAIVTHHGQVIPVDDIAAPCDGRSVDGNMPHGTVVNPKRTPATLQEVMAALASARGAPASPCAVVGDMLAPTESITIDTASGLDCCALAIGTTAAMVNVANYF